MPRETVKTAQACIQLNLYLDPICNANVTFIKLPKIKKQRTCGVPNSTLERDSGDKGES